MKISQHWLKQFLHGADKANTAVWADRLTFAGIEIEGETDHVWDVSLTPNRGDCLSVLGIARELVSLSPELSLQPITMSTFSTNKKNDAKITLDNQSTQDCPVYLGQLILDINKNAQTPQWMQDHIIASGLKCIHPVVDIMNYVMLELGQPLHAFDADTIEQTIIIRRAKENETLQLLDGNEVKLKSNTLVIADPKQVLAMAGIMGGLSSSVTAVTDNIFIESAHFVPAVIVGRARQYVLSTDASHRFERGVDPRLPEIALQRATQLVLEIVGGQLAQTSGAKEEMPAETSITLRYARLLKVSGLNASQLSVEAVDQLLARMYLVECDRDVDGGEKIPPSPPFAKGGNTVWRVVPPSHRFDLNIEEDLIEEICRLHGYNNIVHAPGTTAQASVFVAHANTAEMARQKRLYDTLHVALSYGYQEVITYSFVDQAQQALLHPEQAALELLNPIAQDMNVMRVSLWTGLLNAAQYNRARQQERMKLCELGTAYLYQPQQTSALKVQHQLNLAGICLGDVWPEQWGQTHRAIDFFDVKGDVENILAQMLPRVTFSYHDLSILDSASYKDPYLHAVAHALHPHQAAVICHANGQVVGFVGMLHPKMKQQRDIKESIGLFSLNMDRLLSLPTQQYVGALSKYPGIRRDLALLVDLHCSAQGLIDTANATVSADVLKKVFIFDVYQGKNIPEGKKSVAIGFILQHDERTLVEQEVTDSMTQLMAAFKDKYQAEVRN